MGHFVNEMVLRKDAFTIKRNLKREGKREREGRAQTIKFEREREKSG